MDPRPEKVALNAPTVRQRGQALSEFILLVVGVGIPLLLLIPLIAKYQDIQHATQMASRYLAFEATTQSNDEAQWKLPQQLANEVRSRFFGNPAENIRSDVISSSASSEPFWTNPLGSGMIASPEVDVTVSTNKAGTGSGVADGFDAASDKNPFYGGSPDIPTIMDYTGLPARGIYTANIKVRLANMPFSLGFGGPVYAPFDNIGIFITAQTGTLTASWAASGPQEVVRRLSNPDLIPSLQLQADFAPGSANADIISAVELENIPPPKIGQLAPFIDIVPRDRLH